MLVELLIIAVFMIINIAFHLAIVIYYMYINLYMLCCYVMEIKFILSFKSPTILFLIEIIQTY